MGVDLGYEVPKEGSNVWFDGWVIPKYSRNPKAASYFINYLCREDVALANMETTGYVSSVAGKKVFEAMSDKEAYPETVNSCPPRVHSLPFLRTVRQPWLRAVLPNACT